MSKLEQNSGNVLIVDNEPKVLEQVKRTLEKAGFTVFKAQGRAVALDFCSTNSEPLQLVILDIAAGGDDPELLNELSRFNPGLRVLRTSAQDQAGRRGFLKKPFRRSQLLGRVLDLMDAPLALTA